MQLTETLPVELIALADIAELEEDYWYYTGDRPTCRNIAGHFKLMMQADLQYPIILCAEGRIMDGMHRVTKAFALGQKDVLSVRFKDTPPPDFTDATPDEVFSSIG